mmetsp:Transcript_55448/g.161936  ORF Transcript_55448/g.161936 Transcript_55448/m.161936 type:complete len:86 (+) Transcript_55448:634-891(+)
MDCQPHALARANSKDTGTDKLFEAPALGRHPRSPLTVLQEQSKCRLVDRVLHSHRGYQQRYGLPAALDAMSPLGAVHDDEATEGS